MAFNESQTRFLESFQKSLSTLEWRPLFLLILILLLVVIFGGGFFLSWAFRRRFIIRRNLYYWVKKFFPFLQPSSKRYEAEIPVALLYPLTNQMSDKAYTVDLSPDGMFLKMLKPIEVNSSFEFILKLGSSYQIKGTALVRWAQKSWSEHHPVGMGCEFIDITENDRRAIQEFLEQSRRPKFITQPTIKIR